jgi:hypothetical protein
MRPATPDTVRHALRASLTVLAAAVAVGGLPALASAQAGCQQELKLPSPGEWAEYEGELDNEHAIVRVARLPQDSATTGDLAWVEISINKGKKAKDAQVYQLLTSSYPISLEQVQEIIYKAGSSQATRVGPFMRKMVSSGLEKSGGLRFADVCSDVTLLKNENLTVPGGIFPTRSYSNKTTHLKQEEQYDTWVAGGVPFGLVKTEGWRYNMTLKAFGKDAKPTITETPKDAP